MKIIEISKNQNPELKDKYKQEFFDTLYNAYNVHKAGDVFMVLNEKNPLKDLCKDKYIWSLALDNNEDILAGILYKGDDTPGKEDRKYSLMAAKMPSDASQRATPEAKEALLTLLKIDIENEDRHAWGELSGAVEHFYLDKMNGVALVSTDAQVVMSFKDKEVTPTSDGKHFLRQIGFGKHEKTMSKVLVGHIPLESAKQLKTFKEVELKADCSNLNFETKKAITFNLLIARDFEDESTAINYINNLSKDIRPIVKEIYLSEKTENEKDFEVKSEPTIELTDEDFIPEYVSYETSEK